MHILVCSPSWPTEKTIDFVFVDQLCRAFADLGHKVTVIAPQSLTKCIVRHVPLAPRHYRYKTANGNEIEMYRPYTISLGNYGINTKLGTFEQAVRRAYRHIKDKPDVFYGHFWQCIFALFPLAKVAGIPLCGASGEEDVSYYVHMSDGYINEIRQYLSGVVSVSTKNQQECFALHLISPEKTIVIPNAIDQTLFRKLDKVKCRNELGLSQNDFIVVFVGQFMPRKGTMRLNAALKQLHNLHVKAVFIGSGLEFPDYEGILYKGRVNHDQIPQWLNSSDVFVLPTENEGCCNAIIEAMARGLPIISTDSSFNYDVLDENNSIMVDCHDVDSIANAICTLHNDSGMRMRLSEGALKSAKELTINRRAERIIHFIQEKTQQ